VVDLSALILFGADVPFHLLGKKIEATLTLTGDTRAVR
jgi:hypothetical protein